MSKKCDVIVTSLFYDQFGAIWKPDSGYMVYKTDIFINSNPENSKLKTELKISNTALILLLWVNVLLMPRNIFFLRKNCWHQQS